MKTINIRRSVRSFKNKEVEKKKIMSIIKAGMQAPSAGNQQSWEVIVVNEVAKKMELSRMSPYSTPVKDAPIVIVVLANKDRMRFPENMEQELGAFTENMLLESVEQGLASTWFSVLPQEERIKKVKEVLRLPDNIIPFSLVIVGYPNQDNDNKFIDRFDESRVYINAYGRFNKIIVI